MDSLRMKKPHLSGQFILNNQRFSFAKVSLQHMQQSYYRTSPWKDEWGKLADPKQILVLMHCFFCFTMFHPREISGVIYVPLTSKNCFSRGALNKKRVGKTRRRRNNNWANWPSSVHFQDVGNGVSSSRSAQQTCRCRGNSIEFFLGCYVRRWGVFKKLFFWVSENVNSTIAFPSFSKKHIFWYLCWISKV